MMRRNKGREWRLNLLCSLMLCSLGQQKKFNEAAVGHFGSGWAWLVKSGDGLKVVSTHDAGNPLKDGSGFPIITAE